MPKKDGTPGPLFLVGLGLCDENDLPLRSLEILKGCKSIFAENYTNLMREGTLERLEKKINEEEKTDENEEARHDKKIIQLAREEVEGERIILEAAKEGPVALLVPGDPMTATTHNSLLMTAKEKGIPAKILHASSILSAAPGAAGLQAYKMGKTATITYWRKNYEPTAFLDIIAENQARGAHTLCLLDIDPKLGPMKPSQALELIEKAQKKKTELDNESNEKTPGTRPSEAGAFPSPSARIFILSRVGWPEQRIWAGELKDWENELDAKRPGPCAIIICAKMHFAEEEAWKAAGGQRR